MRRGRPHQVGVGAQRGMALVVALFLVIVIAALGVFALRIGTNQEQTASLELLNYRAAAAAESGLEYGSNRAAHGAWGAANAVLQINGFTVTVTCNPTVHAINAVNYSVCGLSATAVQGVYGRPDYVRRTLTRRISDIPPGTW